MDIYEIRQGFLLSESVSDKIRDFRLDRLSQIGALETPVPLTDGAKIVLHCVPLTAFQSATPVNISDALRADIYALLPRANAYRFNLDGLVIYINFDKERIVQYTQLFRTGAVEAVDNYLMSIDKTDKGVIPTYFESEVIKSCEEILRFQQKLGVEPPILVFLTMLQVKGYKMGVSNNTALWALGRQYGREIDREVILLPEIEIESYSLVDSLSNMLKPIFDACWNASGWPRSMNYDESGKRNQR